MRWTDSERKVLRVAVIATAKAATRGLINVNAKFGVQSMGIEIQWDSFALGAVTLLLLEVFAYMAIVFSDRKLVRYEDDHGTAPVYVPVQQEQEPERTAVDQHFDFSKWEYDPVADQVRLITETCQGK